MTPAPPSNQPLQGPPQFTQFPPTGPYPGQQPPKGAPQANNPFGRNSSRGYTYPQPPQFNQN